MEIINTGRRFIGEVIQIKDNEKLEELAKPLMDYLKENCHPYTSILVDESRVAVVETVLSIPKNRMD